MWVKYGLKICMETSDSTRKKLRVENWNKISKTWIPYIRNFSSLWYKLLKVQYNLKSRKVTMNYIIWTRWIVWRINKNKKKIEIIQLGNLKDKIANIPITI